MALAFAAFERSCLAGRVSKANRALYMAVCLLLAWKMNESREMGAESRPVEGEGAAEAAASPRPRVQLLSVLAAAFRQPKAAIEAEEFPIFVQLGFSLYVRTQQVQPLLDRLEAAAAGAK